MGVRHFQDEGDSFACFGRPPLIGEAVEGAPLTGQLPSAQSGDKLNNSFPCPYNPSITLSPPENARPCKAGSHRGA